MLADYNGHMLKTAPSTATLPMYTAPVLDPTQLASIESLQVLHCANPISSPTLASPRTLALILPRPHPAGLSRYMRIRRVDHYSSTRIKFHLEVARRSKCGMAELLSRPSARPYR